MKYDPGKHHRRSIRLEGYDYTKNGAYFVTMCTYKREFLFGNIVDRKMLLNELGKLICDEWLRSAVIRDEIELFENEFVVMPNHIHGIVWIVGNDKANSMNVVTGDNGVTGVGATGRSPLHGEPPRGPLKKSLSSFIAGFKSVTTKEINKIRNTPGASVWQRNYYEHIIRNDDELRRIREYIINNPEKWEYDKNYIQY